MKYIIFLLIINFGSLLYSESYRLDLATVKELALMNNLEYKATLANYNAKKWNTVSAFSKFLPSVNASGSYLELGEKPHSLADRKHSLSYGLSLNQPVFLGGKIYYNYLINRMLDQIAYLELKNKKLSIINEAEIKYYSYLNAKEIFNINFRNMQNFDELLGISELGLKSNIISRADHLKLEAEFASRQADFYSGELLVRVKKRELANFLNISESFDIVDFDFTVYDDFVDLLANLEIEEMHFFLKDLVNTGKELNLTNSIMEKTRDITNYSTRIAYGNFLPSVSLNISQDWTDNFMEGNNFKSSQSIMINASFPLFPILDNYSNLKSANYERLQSFSHIEKTELEIDLAIESVALQLIISAKRLKSAYLSKEHARASFNLFFARFKSGLISVNDINQAEILLLSSELNYSNLKFEFLRAKATIRQLVNLENDIDLIMLFKKNINGEL